MGIGVECPAGSPSCAYPPDMHSAASATAGRLAEQSTGWATITLALVPASPARLPEVLLATGPFHKALL